MSDAKRILVTGGFGFLGSHLVEALLADESTGTIHVVDNLSTSTLDPDDFLARIDGPPRVTYTVSDLDAYLAEPSHGPFDQIYHLASVVGPAGVLQHAGQIVRSIVGDTYALMERATEWNARLLDVSTSEIYGGGQSGFCSEELPKIVPPETTVRLEYAVAKLAAETAIINTARVTALDSVIIRPFNIAGPRQSGAGGFVLPRFLTQASRGEPLTVFGDGSQIRAFTHVQDTAHGLLLAMRHGRCGEAYNIGNPDNRTTILELAHQVIALTGSSSEIQFTDGKAIYGDLYEEANDKYPDAEKAMREFGWAPGMSLEKVIRDTWAYTLEQAGVAAPAP